MKKLIMAMLIAVSMVQTISAQDNNRQRMTPQQLTEQRIQKMDEKLSLTDEQKSKIRDLYADFNKQKYPKREFGINYIRKVKAVPNFPLVPAVPPVYSRRKSKP